jgi:hypothetical protein
VQTVQVSQPAAPRLRLIPLRLVERPQA